MINIKDFGKLDLRVGTITKAEPLKNATIPAYHLHIDFGKLGVKQSSAQITDLYKPDELINRQIVAIVNLPPKMVAGVKSEALVLGANNSDRAVTLLEPQNKIVNGAKIS